MAPIGFVSDHMEVLYDLDTEATAKAAELGLPVRRSATVGDDPRFAAAVRDLVLERAATERAAVSPLRPRHPRPEPGPVPGGLLPRPRPQARRRGRRQPVRLGDVVPLT